MTADLSGRDLDVACARAMGWHVGEWAAGGELTMLRNPPVAKAQTVYDLRAYGTDPSTLDEKLAWLNSHVWLGGVMLFEEPRRHPKLGRWIAMANECAGAVVERGAREDDARRFRVEGDTIHVATARLVVAVKEGATSASSDPPNQ